MSPSTIIDFSHKVRVFQMQKSNPWRLQLQFVLLDKQPNDWLFYRLTTNGNGGRIDKENHLFP